MDTDNTSRQSAPPRRGGTVEPGDRVAVAKQRFQTPIPETKERYEMRDPIADVTYRTTSIDEMVAKAEQMGRGRFTAIAEDGSRTAVFKVAGQWERGEKRPPGPERALDPLPPRDEVRPASRSAPAAPPARTGANASAVPRIDAEAERAALIARLETALAERYVIKRAAVEVGDVKLGQTEYRFRGDSSRVAFTESTFRLATDTNSPSVARSMVDVAEARNWKGVRVSGSEDFKRMVWLEASVRGVKAVGYEPNPADLEVLKSEREARLVNRIEPARDAGTAETAGTAKGSPRGSGGRKAVLAAIEAVLLDKRVPHSRREAVLAAASEQLALRMREGQAPKIKVYDKTAPPQRKAVQPAPEAQRARDRSDPAPAR